MSELQPFHNELPSASDYYLARSPHGVQDEKPLADLSTYELHLAKAAQALELLEAERAADDTQPAAVLELSVVMPCLNEADTLATCIEKAQRTMSEHQIAGEVLASAPIATRSHRSNLLA